MAITTLTGSNGTYKFNSEDNGNILGKGGMGIVYKGADQNNQPVAIKVMHRAISAHINNIEQAKREATIQIKHKNLIRMLDFIEKDGDHHIVSEFIDGETLRNKLDKSPHGLNQQLCTDITTNILEGLETLHSYNVVHRDIDPSNIMICNDGTAKLMDFGIAKISGYDLQTLTGTGAFKGKYQYAAPEQIKGEKNNINNTTDIYAVGITFYEMLSGVLPYNGDSEFDLMKKHIEDPLPTNNKIPNNLFGLITRATAKNQNDRYKSATEFLEDLGHEKPLKTAKEYFERAEKYREAENWEKAIENYDIVIAKNIKFEDAHFCRAYCYAALSLNNEAILDYSFVIRNSPDESSAYHNRALSFEIIGKINEALVDYKQAIKIDPENELYMNNYASFLEANNLHQQLIDDISEEIKQNPKNSKLFYKKATLHSKLGKIYETIADYKQAIKIDPTEESYKWNYISFLEKNKLYQQLIDDTTEEILINPKDSELYLLRAFAELDLGNKKKFRRDLRMAKDLGHKVAKLVLVKIPWIYFINFVALVIILGFYTFTIANLFAYFRGYPSLSEGNTVFITLLGFGLFGALGVMLVVHSWSNDSFEDRFKKLTSLSDFEFKNNKLQTKISNYLAHVSLGKLYSLNDLVIIILAILFLTFLGITASVYGFIAVKDFFSKI